MRVVKDYEVNEIVIEKSKFITSLFRISSIEEAQDFIAKTKKQYYNATHNCYAFILGKNGEYTKSSDDGEPSGTAGVPILEALKSKDITNSLCIVTRYFGGVKLGVGGLIRAYNSCSIQAIEKASFIKEEIYGKYSIKLPYNLYKQVSFLINQNGLITNTIYEDLITIFFAILDEKKEHLEEDLSHIFNEKITLTKESEIKVDVSL